MSTTFYQPSGAVPSKAYPLAAVCIALTLAIAALYAWIILYVPAFFGFFLCFAFASVMASFAKHVCASAKVRHPVWTGRFGLLLGVSGWYFQWVAWLVMQPGSDQGMSTTFTSIARMAARPDDVLGHVMQFGLSTAGFDRYLTAAAWLGELWVLLFFPHITGKMRAEEIFDESDGKWANHVEMPNRFKLVSQPALLCAIESPSHSLSDILMPETDETSANYSRLRIYRCEDGDPLVSVLNVEVKGKDGRQNVVECWPGRYLRVTETELATLLAKTPKHGGIDECDPPELAQAIECLHRGEFEAAYAEALPFVAADEQGLYCDANRICAIACSQSGQWKQAVVHWRALFAREGTAHNAMQAASSAVMADEVEQGIDWMERAHTLNAASREMSSVTITTTMLSALTAANHLTAALPLLEQLRDVYVALHVTDPTFLFGHQVPLFHVFLEKSGAIVGKVLGKGESRAWYAAMLPHLDERGKTELTTWLEGAGASS